MSTSCSFAMDTTSSYSEKAAGKAALQTMAGMQSHLFHISVALQYLAQLPDGLELDQDAEIDGSLSRCLASVQEMLAEANSALNAPVPHLPDEEELCEAEDRKGKVTDPVPVDDAASAVFVSDENRTGRATELLLMYQAISTPLPSAKASRWSTSATQKVCNWLFRGKKLKQT